MHLHHLQFTPTNLPFHSSINNTTSFCSLGLIVCIYFQNVLSATQMSITSSYFSHVDMLSIVECNCSLTYCFFYFKLVVPFPQTICILPLIRSGFFSSSFNSLNFPQEISSFILQNRCKNGGLKARNISLCTETVESSMLIISVISSQVNYGYYVLCDRKKS